MLIGYRLTQIPNVRTQLGFDQNIRPFVKYFSLHVLVTLYFVRIILNFKKKCV